MLGPPALAQEIWNYIMVFLHGRTEDLKACSLVSRTLGIAAQSQLFHTVAVLPTPITTLWINDKPILHTNEVASARALRALCLAAPHHAQSIRRLELPWLAEAVKEIILLAMRPGLGGVRELLFYRWKGSLDMNPTRIDERTLKLARRLISISGLALELRRLELHRIHQPEAFFTRLVGDATRLREICFEACELYNPGEGEGDQATPSAPAQVRFASQIRRVITHMQLVDSRTLAPWLLGPFDLTRLTHVDVSASLDADVARILLGAATTLRELALMLIDAQHCPPLWHFSALTHLTFHVDLK